MHGLADSELLMISTVQACTLYHAGDEPARQDKLQKFWVDRWAGGGGANFWLLNVLMPRGVPASITSVFCAKAISSCKSDCSRAVMRWSFGAAAAAANSAARCSAHFSCEALSVWSRLLNCTVCIHRRKVGVRTTPLLSQCDARYKQNFSIVNGPCQLHVCSSTGTNAISPRPHTGLWHDGCQPVLAWLHVLRPGVHTVGQGVQGPVTGLLLSRHDTHLCSQLFTNFSKLQL